MNVETINNATIIKIYLQKYGGNTNVRIVMSSFFTFIEVSSWKQASSIFKRQFGWSPFDVKEIEIDKISSGRKL